MTQCLPCLWAGDTIGDQAVIMLKRGYGTVRAVAEITVGVHGAIDIAVADAAQLLLQHLHGVTRIPVFEGGGIFCMHAGCTFAFLGFAHAPNSIMGCLVQDCGRARLGAVG